MTLTRPRIAAAALAFGVALWLVTAIPFTRAADPVAPAEPVAKTDSRKPDNFEKAKGFWSFQPLKKPAVPAVKDTAWVANPVDAFVLAKLETAGLKPAPPADKVALIRRVYYDLTGLPPTPAEIDAFVADASPRAYEALVDRLLDSPRYGEQWARHWLDLVRYAETNSYERDNPKPNAWRYRDYVIRAFNSDKPYDRFVCEQLAGDEMPGRDGDALIATGFYRLGIWDDEPSDREQAQADSLDDIVATTGEVFLGLTVGCARCHDHKLDPILQKDYYRMVAFVHGVNHFHNGGPTDEQPIPKPGGPTLEQVLIERNKKLAAMQDRLTAIETEFRNSFHDVGAADSHDLDDLTYRYYRDSWSKLPDFDSLKPEDTGKLPGKLFDLAPSTRIVSFGFVFEGNLVVTKDGDYTFFLDGDDGVRLTLDDNVVINYDGIHGVGNEQQKEIKLTKGRHPIRLDYFQGCCGMGLSVAWSGPGFDRRTLSATRDVKSHTDLAHLIASDGPRVFGQQKADEYHALRRNFEKAKAEAPATDMALCVTERGPNPPDTFVLMRGNPHVPGDRVEPAFPQIFGSAPPLLPKPAPDAKTSGRRTVLANWIASPDNMLTARVMANRIFQYHFGRGIVRSPNNFGLQGDKPTHPELLDYLATQFIDSGWRVKTMHRLIMTSNAYRMSSRPDPKALAGDPQNDLLSHFDMRRLTAEETRDSILAVNGSINLKMYGPSVYPPIPKEVMAGQSDPGKGWPGSTREDAVRRSVYVHVKRSLLVPLIESLDAAETDRSCPVRFATTQPTQALGMINGSFLRNEAAQLASRLRTEAGPAPDAQIALALRLVTGRKPSEAEIQRGLDLMTKLEKDGATADAALNNFCLVALNLNEFIYLD